MRQTFDETTDPSFGREHAPLIREAMAAQGLDGFVIPHEDEHQNEYLPAANDRLAWATGFTGSAGAAVILKDKAAIFVDGRYTLQVRDQVDTGLFEVRDLVEGGVPAYLQSDGQGRAGPSATIPRLHSPEALERLKPAAAKAGAALKPGGAQPARQGLGPARGRRSRRRRWCRTRSSSPARTPPTSASASARAWPTRAPTPALITAPASIAWLFNIRGGDVIRSPLPLAQAILNADGSARAVPRPGQGDAGSAGLARQRRARWSRPKRCPARWPSLHGQRVLVDPAPVVGLVLRGAGATPAPSVVRGADPTALPRACKNAVEIEGAAPGAHPRRRGPGPLPALGRHRGAQTACRTSSRWCAKLEGFREATGALKDLSFDTIAGAASNGAIVHYRPTKRLAKRAGARLAAAGRLAAPSTWTAPPTSPARSPSATPTPEMRRALHPGAEGPPGAGPRALPGRHHRLGAGRAGAGAAVGGRARLRPRHRPRRRLLPRRPRGPAADLQAAQQRARCGPA